MSKIEKHNINDLLNDDKFIIWVTSNFKTNNHFWMNFKSELDTEDLKKFDNATLILSKLKTLNIDDSKSVKSEAFIKQQYINLLEASNKIKSSKLKVLRPSNFLKYAAAVILLISIATMYFTSTKNTTSFAEHLTKTEYNNTDILIQTSTYEYFKISEDTNSKWLLKNGVLVNVNSETINFISTDNLISNKNDDAFKIIVPKGKKYALTLIDGTAIELNSNSTISFNNSTISKQRKVDLSGEAFFDVAHNKKRPFIVQSSDLKIEVLGTEFNVSNYENDGYTSTTLINGSINVSNPHGENQKIKPGTQAKLYHNQNKIIVQNVNVQNEVSWTMNRMIFENEKLENIVTRLDNWYNVSFILKDEKIKQFRFTGTLKKENELIHFLQMLKYTEGISYKIIENKVELFFN
ncbi:DUF4974 domain-containing protein [Lutibacter sp. A64]|uniref:FecR family protein n=1 Tax=Lutibacter sp. A64 TaxID=2918526 RepID=UPI001F06F88F|nr:FecR domain-containing protein [Lutibacter sp. A64]UMB55123.1 DUF4974 domain-containing protein [Lutibacter sp. A64]